MGPPHEAGSRGTFRRYAGMIVVACVVCILAAGCSADSEAAAQGELRVCADPNNLPFSNRQEEGFENRIADLIASDLGAEVSYTWHQQRRGFIRKTLRAEECDVVMAIPSSFELALPTRPYYRSTFVFVRRADADFEIRSFDDDVLRELQIGIPLVGDDYQNPPAAEALARRGIIDNVVGYSVYDDRDAEGSTERILRDLARRDIDLAVLWGPLAGFHMRSVSDSLEMTPVSPQIDLPFLPFVFDISMGVRRGDSVRVEQLERSLDRNQEEIRDILEEYGVPLLETGAGRRPAVSVESESPGADPLRGDSAGPSHAAVESSDSISTTTLTSAGTPS